MRDFYIYGFKSRNEFQSKSARTYDNEKRRCESYLGPSMKWSYSGGNKVSFVSVDCGKVSVNPLYSAWKSKSFTANDIMLHFYLFDLLKSEDMPLDRLTSEICNKSGIIFDLQTVRAKCNEYVDCGLFAKYKKGKGFFYKLAEKKIDLDDELLDAVTFFQGGSLGIIGSYIMDNADIANDLFIFKHHYIAHTLEDGVLYDILQAIHQHRKVQLARHGTKSGKLITDTVYPVKIFASAWTGRRYLCAYISKTARFTTYRLDGIKTIEMLEPVENHDEINAMLARNIDKVWGVSFDGITRNEFFKLTLHIDEEREPHVINRIKKEGRGGSLERIDKDTFLFTKEVFDANEALPWVKTFIGRIVSYESISQLEKKLRNDIQSMAKMYGIGSDK